MGRNNLSGRWGEAVAADYLRKKHYQILCGNYRCRLGEIDLIAANRKFLVFVEVKTRKDRSFATAAEFVDRRKQQRLIAAAQLYLCQNETQLQPRFDVIEIYAPQGVETRRPEVHHLENAFDVTRN